MDLMSSIHPMWDSTSSQERAISLTPLLVNSPLSFWTLPSSVVQTGVKSAGWENRIAQLSASQLWKSILPWLVSAVKLGTMSPSKGMFILDWTFVQKLNFDLFWAKSGDLMRQDNFEKTWADLARIILQ